MAYNVGRFLILVIILPSSQVRIAVIFTGVPASCSLDNCRVCLIPSPSTSMLDIDTKWLSTLTWQLPYNVY